MRATADWPSRTTTTRTVSEMGLLSGIRNLFVVLREHEKLVLDAVAARLEGTVKTMFAAQVGKVSRADRAADGKEVILRGPTLTDADRFAEDGHVLLGTVLVSAHEMDVRSEVWLVGGALFSVTFDSPPSRWASNDLRVKSVKVWEDPMLPPAARQAIDEHKVRDWFADLPCAGSLSSLTGPLPPDVIERRLHALGCTVPRDWRDLAQLSDGLQCGPVQVHGLSGARVVVLAANELVVVAESDEPRLLVLDRTKNDGRVYEQSLEDETARDLGPSFREALKSYTSTLTPTT